MHLAIIMDGNRRWAKEKKLPVNDGHRHGYEKVKEMLGWCREREIKTLTLYAFSTENWSRHEREVNFLMRLFALVLKKDIEELHKNGIRLRVIGLKEMLPLHLQKLIKEAENLTKDNQEFSLNLAISYGGRAEIIEAVKQIIREEARPEDITEELINQHLWTAGLPDPDFIIRTSGELRTSNFLIWQSIYSEWYLCQKYWPDFSEEDLDKALADYNLRQQRRGK